MAILEREDRGAVAWLTLNAPERLNALSDAMLTALAGAWVDLAADGAIRAVVLQGAGRAFCAGHDLAEMTRARQSEDAGRAAFADLFARCAAVMRGIAALPQPVIARVHGVATAAGCQLVASCDMAVAADDARFGVNGIDVGLFCATPMVALTRAVPRKQAFEMLTTGGFIGAARAVEIGLVNRAVPPADLDAAVAELAGRVAAKPAQAMRIGKAAFHRQVELPVDAAYEVAGAAMVENMLTNQAAEGIGAFLGKRDPDWRQ
jgi:enoyl-CoA hydratase/carnithine racemase